MINRFHADWSHHIDQVIRSKHYTWLGEGLGGMDLEDALLNLTTDIMHICKREGISWSDLVAKSQCQLVQEEEESRQASQGLELSPP